MNLPGENQKRGASFSVKYLITGLAVFTAFAVGLMLFGQNDKTKSKPVEDKAQETVLALDHQEEAAVETTGEENLQPVYNADGRLKDIEKLYQEKRLTAADLDFWDMYPPEEPERYTQEELDAEAEKEKNDELTQREKYEQKEKEGLEEEAEKDPSSDGKHTLLTYADGEEEWVLLNPYLEQNTYDFTKLTMKADQMAYMEDGKKKSYIGVDLSKYNGAVDFGRLKETGIDYVMLRVGARGYGSGQITADERFVQNIADATAAGLNVGLYFFSQAISAQEAVEEANYVLQSIGEYKVTYPIAFDMEYIANDTARIETLSPQQKTTVAKAFLDTVKNAGYKPMLYGTKEWLIKEVDLTKLTDYDVWLSQQKDMPDYPYQFQMWQYSQEGKISGIDGEVDLNISFIDYSEK